MKWFKEKMEEAKDLKNRIWRKYENSSINSAILMSAFISLFIVLLIIVGRKPKGKSE